MLAASEGSAGRLLELVRASKDRNLYSHFNTQRVCRAGDDGRAKREQRDGRRKRVQSSLTLFSCCSTDMLDFTFMFSLFNKHIFELKMQFLNMFIILV